MSNTNKFYEVGENETSHNYTVIVRAGNKRFIGGADALDDAIDYAIDSVRAGILSDEATIHRDGKVMQVYRNTGPGLSEKVAGSDAIFEISEDH